MRKAILSAQTLSGLLVLLVMAPAARAQDAVPGLMAYAGELSTLDGEAAPDAVYDLGFRLYATPTEGDVLWEEVLARDPGTGEGGVLVEGGRFVVYLGETTPLAADLFRLPAIYLGVTVGVDGTEMQPRQRLSTLPYALLAESAGTCDAAANAANAATFDGHAWSEVAPASHTHAGTDVASPVANALAAGTCDFLDGLDSLDFAPVLHGHAGSDIEGAVALCDTAGRLGPYTANDFALTDHLHDMSSLEGVAPAVHTHSGADITSPVAVCSNADTVDGVHAEVLEESDEIQSLASAIATQLDGVRGDIGALEALLYEADGQLQSLQGEVDALQPVVGTLQTAVGTLTTDLNALESLVGQQRSELDALGDRVGTNETDIAALEAQVASQLTAIATLQSQVTTLGDDRCPRGYTPETLGPLTICRKGSDEMVKAGDVWVDRYEASVWQAGTCGGTQYGAGDTDDYPTSFPDNGQFTARVYACSKAGVFPSRNITYFQAQAACAAAGKHLITNAEWQQAAVATPDPGSNDGLNGSCRTNNAAAFGLTGAHPACLSAWGAQDLIGNAWEWTANWYGHNATGFDSTQPAAFNGDSYENITPAQNQATDTQFPPAAVRGGYKGSGTQAGVFAITLKYAPSVSNLDIGFRCARGY